MKFRTTMMEDFDWLFLFLVVLFTTCCGSSKEASGGATTKPTLGTITQHVNASLVHPNVTVDTSTPATMVRVNPSKISGMALRAFYVIIAVSSIVIVYFVVRSVCSRKRRQNTRRYGILRGDKQDQMEMHPLSEVEDDDDEDDLTLFDISDQKRNGRGGKR